MKDDESNRVLSPLLSLDSWLPLPPHDGPCPPPLSRPLDLVYPQVEPTGVAQGLPLPVLPPGGGLLSAAVRADALPPHHHRLDPLLDLILARAELRLRPTVELDIQETELLIRFHGRVAGSSGGDLERKETFIEIQNRVIGVAGAVRGWA